MSSKSRRLRFIPAPLLSAHGDVLAVAFGKRLYLLNSRSSDVLLSVNAVQPVTAIALNQRGDRIAVCTDDKHVTVYKAADAPSSTWVMLTKRAGPKSVSAVTFGVEGSSEVFFGDRFGEVYSFDSDDLNEKASPQAAPAQIPETVPTTTSTTSTSTTTDQPTGAAATSGKKRKTSRDSREESKKKARRLQLQLQQKYQPKEGSNAVLKLGHLAVVSTLAISRDGRHIFSGDRDAKLRVSKLPNCDDIESLCLGHIDMITCVHQPSFRSSPFPHIVISGDVCGELKVWNFLTGQQLATFQFPAPPEALSTSAIANNNAFQMTDAVKRSTGINIFRVPPSLFTILAISTVCISSDTVLVAVAIEGYQRVQLLRLKVESSSRAELQPLSADNSIAELSSPLLSCAFSADNTLWLLSHGAPHLHAFKLDPNTVSFQQVPAHSINAKISFDTSSPIEYPSQSAKLATVEKNLRWENQKKSKSAQKPQHEDEQEEDEEEEEDSCSSD